jgi:hypothetical protein
MQLVNETNTAVMYSISSSSSGDCGQIPVDGMVDLPAYDNQTNVTVSFLPVDVAWFKIDVGTTTTGEQVEMAVVFEPA